MLLTVPKSVVHGSFLWRGWGSGVQILPGRQTDRQVDSREGGDRQASDGHIKGEGEEKPQPSPLTTNAARYHQHAKFRQVAHLGVMGVQGGGRGV